MSLKICPKHGSYNSIFCSECEKEGLVLCVHCGLNLKNLSINEIINHLETHKDLMDGRSKELLEVCKQVDYDAINTN